MKLYFIGISGTFMANLAILGRQLGHEVAGVDANCYPPMSDLLAEQEIQVDQGYDPQTIDQYQPDLIVVGNAISRDNPIVSHILTNKLAYCSGPQWLSEHVLAKKSVIAVAGTHGKTSVSSMIAWVLKSLALDPGYLIGGVVNELQPSVNVGEGQYFVIEADEYDTAFFDKRPKFVHYQPTCLVLNNLEFDHADIYDDLEQIKRQFSYLLRIVPDNGELIVNGDDANLAEVIKRGCWTPKTEFGLTNTADLYPKLLKEDGSQFEVFYLNESIGVVDWQMIGIHNVVNALATIGACLKIGQKPAEIIAALNMFAGIKRRMEVRGEVNGHTVYDDFAHHPSEIKTTIAGLRQKIGDQPLIAVIELGSNSMKSGAHLSTLPDSWQQADQVYLLKPDGLDLDIPQSNDDDESGRVVICSSADEIVDTLKQQHLPNSHILVMSNRGFDGIHERLLSSLD